MTLDTDVFYRHLRTFIVYRNIVQFLSLNGALGLLSG